VGGPIIIKGEGWRNIPPPPHSRHPVATIGFYIRPSIAKLLYLLVFLSHVAVMLRRRIMLDCLERHMIYRHDNPLNALILHWIFLVATNELWDFAVDPVAKLFQRAEFTSRGWGGGTYPPPHPLRLGGMSPACSMTAHALPSCYCH
jgi:hypothetical protein